MQALEVGFHYPWCAVYRCLYLIFSAYQKAGADVVGFNCHRGPATMMPLLELAVKAVKCPIAALPVPYRTSEKEPTFFSLTDDQVKLKVNSIFTSACALFMLPQLPACTVNNRPFPVALDPKLCSRYEIAEFSRKAHELGVRYLGVCCGTGACYESSSRFHRWAYVDHGLRPPGPHHIRAMAEAVGRTPAASRYSPDISKHFAFGTDKTLKAVNQEAKDKL